MSSVRVSNVRRLAAGLLIVQQLLTGTGVALPIPAAAARSAERYPCEDCSCGCQSAEQCWRNCCCHTTQQKIAWAKQHGVAVPEFVLAAAREETAAVEKPKCRHCVRRADTQTNVSSTASRNRGHQDRAKCEKRRPTEFSWLNALRCHGSTEFWLAAGASWPGDRPVELRLALPHLGRIQPQPFLKELFLTSAPPTPPPKKLW
jgi:hypothetical protein